MCFQKRRGELPLLLVVPAEGLLWVDSLCWDIEMDGG